MSQVRILPGVSIAPKPDRLAPTLPNRNFFFSIL
jgi:hypothetical protein